jgi:hypothetical protein
MKLSIPIRLLVILLPFIVLSSSFLQAENEECEELGSVTFIEGQCQVKSGDGEYGTAVLDQAVHSSDTVKTLKDSGAEITLLDGNVMKITEDTEVTLDTWQVREESRTNIGLLFGSVKLFVKRFSKDKDEFTVATATVTAGVRGTEFDVSLREDGEVLINVEEGSIETEYDGDTHTIAKGNAAVYNIEGQRKDYKGRVEYTQWRREALERIKENPALFLKRMLARERVIIARLKQNQVRMEQYRKEFAVFLKKAQYLHGRKMYRQERALIIQQIEKTKRVLRFFILARRQLAGIRSLIVLAGRIEKQLDPETARELPSLQELRREYGRITYVITKINEADKKLRQVLFMLNRRLDELNKSIEAGG